MSRTILIMAGGTGGHVFPALAVADYLAALGWSVVWLGTRNGMEARLVPQHGYPLEFVKFSGVRGKGALSRLPLPFFILVAFCQSVAVLLRRRPDVVLGMGGYAAFPGGMMAALLHRPLVIHEQNSVAGLTNRVLAAVADRVLAGFPAAFEQPIRHRLARLLPGPRRVEWSGNPVRAEIAALPGPRERMAGRTGPLHLLVIGGSQGALVLNETLPQALALIPLEARPEVVHQSGAAHLGALRAAYERAQVAAQAAAFIEDMAQRYAWCDLVVCRAGALTVAEVAAAGVASVLVPFPSAVDDHQTVNARFLADAGAAVLLPQAELSPQRLAQILRDFTRGKLLAMAEAARKLAKPDVTRLVAEACMDLAK